MQRVHIVGNSGSGKSTLARQLSKKLRMPRLELDALYHQADWQPLQEEDFRSAVEHFVENHDRWVVEGNYTAVRAILWGRADTVIWTDPGRFVNLRAVISRTCTRFIRQEELWNGNREPIRNFLSLSPERSIIAWTWMRHPVIRRRYASLMRDPAFEHINFIRLRSYQEISQWLRGVDNARGVS